MAVPRGRGQRVAMITRRARPGLTLIELLFVLTVVGVLTGLAAPSLRHGFDRLAVRSARDALAAGVARTRAFAVARGGAVLVVAPSQDAFWIEATSGEPLTARVDLGRQYGVRLVVDGSPAEPLRLHFDGRGIGRLVNRSFHLRRGRAEAGLVLSSQGRPRRW